jgi:hypothetical protein
VIDRRRPYRLRLVPSTSSWTTASTDFVPRADWTIPTHTIERAHLIPAKEIGRCALVYVGGREYGLCEMDPLIGVRQSSLSHTRIIFRPPLPAHRSLQSPFPVNPAPAALSRSPSALLSPPASTNNDQLQCRVARRTPASSQPLTLLPPPLVPLTQQGGSSALRMLHDAYPASAALAPQGCPPRIWSPSHASRRRRQS